MERNSPNKKDRTYTSADEEELLAGDTVEQAVQNAAMNFTAALNKHADGKLIKKSNLIKTPTNVIAGTSSDTLEGKQNTAAIASTSAGPASVTDAGASGVILPKQNKGEAHFQQKTWRNPSQLLTTSPKLFSRQNQKRARRKRNQNRIQRTRIISVAAEIKTN